jgi:hypothetical protein
MKQSGNNAQTRGQRWHQPGTSEPIVARDVADMYCAQPYPSQPWGRLAADYLELGGWNVQRHEPAHPVGQLLKVATVYHPATAETVGELTCHPGDQPGIGMVVFL